MRLPNKELRTFIYNRLNAAITYATRTIPINSIPAKSETFSFIHISNISVSENYTKDKYGTLCSVEIDVNTQSNEQLANYDECESISDDVCQRLVDYLGSTTNFNIIWAHFISATEQTELTETAYSINNILTIEYYIEEK